MSRQSSGEKGGKKHKEVQPGACDYCEREEQENGCLLAFNGPAVRGKGRMSNPTLDLGPQPVPRRRKPLKRRRSTGAIARNRKSAAEAQGGAVQSSTDQKRKEGELVRRGTISPKKKGKFVGGDSSPTTGEERGRGWPPTAQRGVRAPEAVIYAGVQKLLGRSPIFWKPRWRPMAPG